MRFCCGILNGVPQGFTHPQNTDYKHKNALNAGVCLPPGPPESIFAKMKALQLGCAPQALVLVQFRQSVEGGL